MKMSEPIGNAAFAPLLMRMSLGFFFILSGRAKLNGLPGIVLPAFVTKIKDLHVMPDQLATIYALLLPYVEVLAGAMLLLGIWTTCSAGIASILLASWVYMFGLYTEEVPKLLNKDVVLLAAALSLLYSGAGYFSIDRFRKSG